MLEPQGGDNIGMFFNSIRPRAYFSSQSLTLCLSRLASCLPTLAKVQLGLIPTTINSSPIFVSTRLPPHSFSETETAVLFTQVIKVDRDERLVAIKLTTLPPGVQPTPKVVAPPPAAEEAAAPPATEA